MKKILLLALSAAMLLSIVSCADPTIEQPEVDTNAPAADVGQLTEQPEPIEKINVTYELVKPFGTYKDPNATVLSPEDVEAMLKDENVIIPDDVVPEMPFYTSSTQLHTAILAHSFDNVSVDVNAEKQYATRYCAPAFELEGYVLHHVEKGSDSLTFVYVSEELATEENASRYFDYGDSIRVTVSMNPVEDPHAYTESVFRSKFDEEGYIYSSQYKFNRIGFITNGYTVYICAPKAIATREFLRSLCKAEVVTLVAGVGVVDNAVVDNALAVK